jgi:5'/3'-nucleotidase SurE
LLNTFYFKHILRTLVAVCLVLVFHNSALALKIMLVNDDGYDRGGLPVLFDVLKEAGHEVTIVAPKTDQSGRGTSINTDKINQPLEVVNYDTHKWYVDGTPTVAVIAGLNYILKDNPPDLVISGINPGENIGRTAVSSGTVSAAVAALNRGVPAIAVSLGINLAESSTGYPSTIAAYKPTSLFIVRLIAQLEATKKQNAKLLPSGIGLSINVPVTENKGIAFTRLERFTPLDLTFGELPGGGVGLQIFPVSLPLGSIPNPRSEGEQFVSGFTTITPIDGDWSASDAVRVRLSDRLNIQNLLP